MFNFNTRRFYCHAKGWVLKERPQHCKSVEYENRSLQPFLTADNDLRWDMVTVTSKFSNSLTLYVLELLKRSWKQEFCSLCTHTYV